MNKRNLFVYVWGWIIFLTVITGCEAVNDVETNALSDMQSTNVPVPTGTSTEIAKSTQTKQDITPTVVGTLLFAAAGPEDQIYTDPGGVYSLIIPASWKWNEEKNRFTGENGFVESGILYDKGYMGSALQVCQWMANIDQNGNASVGWIHFLQSCLVTPITDEKNPTVIAVIENPNVSLENHFVYIKTDLENYSYIGGQIQWLNTSEYQPVTNQLYLQSAKDEFWAEVTSSETDFQIDMYLLSDEAQLDHLGDSIFLKYIPEEALPPKSTGSGNLHQIPSWEALNQDISAYGYEFRKIEDTVYYELYYQGDFITDGVYVIPTLHRFSTLDGERIVFVVESLIIDENASERIKSQTRYLAENDGIIKWEEGPENPMESSERIIMLNDELLWARIGDHTNVEVQNKQHEVLFSFSTYFGTSIPINGFRSWNGHWILQISNFVIVDGEILNEKYGFEEVYRWGVFNEKPLYFFRNGAKSGISYDGQILPVAYDEIVHGYCCGLALNNPGVSSDAIRFFAKDGGYWYYVVIK